MIPNHVPDQWVTEAARKGPSEPRRRPITRSGVLVWWVGVPVLILAFWGGVVGLVWWAAQ